jgi:hypothetical protein
MQNSNSFNPAVEVLDISITVGIETADKTGWEFSDLYEQSRRRDNSTGDVVESYEDAAARIKAEWSMTVVIKGNPTAPKMHYYLESTNNECGDSQPTGDDEQTIKDVIQWLTDGVTEKVRDHSYDANNCYQPAFTQFATMEV